MTELDEREFPIKHGTSHGYGRRKCRCDYCTAAARVSARRASIEQKRPLLTAIREAALVGGTIPEGAEVQRSERLRTSYRKRSDAEKAKTKGEVEQATHNAHQARLRAVEHVNGDVAKLALLSVAEITTDPLRELRYRRVVESL